MIQRIQSIYLLLAAILMAVVAFVSPIVDIKEGYALFAMGIKDVENVIYPTWGIVSLAGLSALLSFITVFLFKNRKIQRKIALLGVLVILFFFVTIATYLMAYNSEICSVLGTIHYGTILPVLALIFLLLAARSIQKDEKLVKSLDRLR